jgi:hypothetical protein
MTQISMNSLVLPRLPSHTNETLLVHRSSHTDTQQQVAASRRMLRAGGLQG